MEWNAALWPSTAVLLETLEGWEAPQEVPLGSNGSGTKLQTSLDPMEERQE